MSVLTVSQEFDWNVTNNLSTSKSFSWKAGQGIVYWYRIVLNNYSHTACETNPDCPNIQTTEILTMMATSVSHLCKRLGESCQPLGNKTIKSIQRWSRPAFCCDVKDASCNQLIAEDICVDACEPYVNCGFFTLGFLPQLPKSFLAFNFEKGYQAGQVSEKTVSTQCFPGLLSKKIILETGLVPGENSLYFNPLSGVWQGHANYENCHYLWEWACTDELGKACWRFQVVISKGNKRSRLLVLVAEDLTKISLWFRLGVLGNKFFTNATLFKEVLHDDLGVFADKEISFLLRE